MLHHSIALHSTTSTLVRFILVRAITLVLQYQFEKPVLAMAAAAVRAESTVVDVLMGMTAAADLGGGTRVTAGLVAGIAREITVRPQQGIPRLLFVIKLPEIPGIGCVAILTLCAQGTFVMIVRFMTADAVGGCTDKLPFHMTAFAGDDLMHADQRKLREVMVKPEYGRPALGDMAGRTYLHLGLLVDIIGGMAGCAIARQRICQRAGVTADAGQLAVRPR